MRRPKHDEHSQGSYTKAVSVASKKEIHHSHTVESLSTYSQPSSSTTMFGNRGVAFVYSRRNKKAKEISDVPLVDCHQPLQSKTAPKNGCLLLGGQGFDAFKVLGKRIEVDSINDSCSSSKSNVELSLDSLKGEMNENGGCSSSSLRFPEVMRDTQSEIDACVSLLISKARLSSTTLLVEESGTSSGNSYTRSCKICDHLDSTENMLICDRCEDAFHGSCCNPQIKEITEDEWFCYSCLRKKRYPLREIHGRKSLTSTSEMDSYEDVESSPIYLMLSETEPYNRSVPLGKRFQAKVPDWSGPINGNIDNDAFGEPLKTDTPDFSNLHHLNSESSTIVNWLQCRAVIQDIGEVDDEIICGKWRRAPLHEEQSENWECFDAVAWDPCCADCAVPQELETDQVLKQLKYVEKLKSQSRTFGRKQKLGKNKKGLNLTK